MYGYRTPIIKTPFTFTIWSQQDSGFFLHYRKIISNWDTKWFKPQGRNTMLMTEKYNRNIYFFSLFCERSHSQIIQINRSHVLLTNSNNLRGKWASSKVIAEFTLWKIILKIHKRRGRGTVPVGEAVKKTTSWMNRLREHILMLE